MVRQPKTAPKVVFVTGGVSAEEARRLLDRVPNPMLLEPLDAGSLRDAVAERMRTS